MMVILTQSMNSKYSHVTVGIIQDVISRFVSQYTVTGETSTGRHLRNSRGRFYVLLRFIIYFKAKLHVLIHIFMNKLITLSSLIL
jgi:hypothetical protein